MRTRTISALMVTLLAGTVIAQTTPGRPDQPAPGQTQPGQPARTPPGQTQPGQPSYRDPTQPIDRGMHKQVSAEELSKFTRDWGADQQKAIRTLTQKYGQPTEATESHVIWKDAGQFKNIMVMKEGAQHLFPMPHQDFVGSCISMRVPIEKIGELSKFDGSITVNRTMGIVSAMCDDEQHNILALNLAHDIATGSKTADQARSELARIAKSLKDGQQDPLATDLSFQPDLAAADPDQPARNLATPESPLGTPGIDKDKDRDLDKDKNNPGKKPGETPKSNPEVPRR